MKVFLKSIKESSIEKILSPQLRILSWNSWIVFPTGFLKMSYLDFLLQVPFWTFVSHLPFVSPFLLYANILTFFMGKVLLRQLTFCEFIFLLCSQNHVSPLLLFAREGTPVRSLHHVFLNTWCGVGESWGLGNHYSRTSSLSLFLWDIMRFSYLL